MGLSLVSSMDKGVKGTGDVLKTGSQKSGGPGREKFTARVFFFLISVFQNDHFWMFSERKVFIDGK